MVPEEKATSLRTDAHGMRVIRGLAMGRGRQPAVPSADRAWEMPAGLRRSDIRAGPEHWARWDPTEMA